MMLEKGRVTWPMKSRPMGSSSHTTNRNTARLGNVRMKVIVSSQTGLNPGKYKDDIRTKYVFSLRGHRIRQQAIVLLWKL